MWEMSYSYTLPPNLVIIGTGEDGKTSQEPSASELDSFVHVLDVEEENLEAEQQEKKRPWQ